MPYLDEVRAATRAAWVLVPGVDFGLPAPRTFEAKLAGIGGRYTRRRRRRRRCTSTSSPPFTPARRTGVLAGPAGDADVSTRLLEPPGQRHLHDQPPVAVAGVTLLAGLSAPDLPRGMDLEVSSDGTTFERIGRRRRGRETVDLAWVNGHPQFLVDDLAFSVPLDGRVVTAVRIVPNESRSVGRLRGAAASRR